jgi:hypothetical protein
VKGAGGSPWDVPGLKVDVNALIGGAPAKASGGEAPAKPSGDARALVAASPQLSANVERCQDAVVAARSTVQEALGGGHAHETPQVEAWLALMDEVLNFGEAMTNALLNQRQSQSIRRNK